jgi:hypothetical protein
MKHKGRLCKEGIYYHINVGSPNSRHQTGRFDSDQDAIAFIENSNKRWEHDKEWECFIVTHLYRYVDGKFETVWRNTKSV